ncbi:MAG TPA: tetratricopeptide repeat protein [Candidatus Limnocylindria bacterium]|nr:tetratricopeptide repeat protein [Candidatus Limnocylindria bacterium]
MSDFLAGALGVLLATNQPAALSNLVVHQTGITVTVPATNDPVELELQKLMVADDAAQEAANKIVDATQQPVDPLVAPAPLTLRARLEETYKPVREGYEDFLKRHPDHARGWMAYASFLHDIGDEEGSIAEYEKARELDPKDPAAWNNLANIYAHIGPVAKAFPYYEEAVRLKPDEPLYLHNFGTLVFLFRRDATNYFKCDEQAVFSRALALYDRALKLDPKNFPLASDVAQTYYGIKPPPTTTPEEFRLAELHLADQALGSWTNALSIAGDGVEREGVYLHFARWNIRIGRFAEARTNLASVTNAMYLQVKERLERNLLEKDPPAAKP